MTWSRDFQIKTFTCEGWDPVKKVIHFNDKNNNSNNDDNNNDNNKNDNNNSTKVTHIGCMVVPDPCKDKCDPGWCGFSKIPPP